MLSTNITLNGDLYASSNVFVIIAHFAASVYPTILSGEMILMNGKSDSFAIVAANAVLPVFGGPKLIDL
jgi:hypothetical protein